MFITEKITLLGNQLLDWLDDFILYFPRIILTVVFLFIAYKAAGFMHKLFKKTLLKFAKDPTIKSLLESTSKVIYWTAILILALNILDLNKTVTSILAGVGIAGMVLGLAFQDSISNILGGITISLNKNYQVGDLVKTNDFLGVVEAISLRFSSIRLLDGQIVTLPNKKIAEDAFINYSSSTFRRIELKCGVSYAEDLGHVESLLLKQFRETSFIEQTGAYQPKVYFDAFGGSAVDIVIYVWINTNHISFLEAKSQLLIITKKVLDSHNINIPFPVRTLDFGIKGGDGLRSILDDFTKKWNIQRNYKTSPQRAPIKRRHAKNEH